MSPHLWSFTLKNIASIRFLVSLLLLSIVTIDAYSAVDQLTSCGSSYRRTNGLKLQRPPKRVLLVPLLSSDPHTNESPRWSEQPARILAAFYKNRFNADVTQLRDVWSWTDYFRKIEQIAQPLPYFDRVIFISHGGFDGPVLKNAVFWQGFRISGSKAELTQYSEAQPGLKNILSITFDAEKNRLFSDYMNSRRQDLAAMKPSEVWRLLKEREKQLQPLDLACFQRYCSPEQLAASSEQQRAYRLNLCELTCREALFEQKTSVEISPERFFHFAKSLSSLVTTDGLIFFGACNPGSAAPINTVEHDETELLINSNLDNGPYKSYVHLVSAATDRITAGPIGISSAEDIVNRTIMLESGRPQNNLCIISPAEK